MTMGYGVLSSLIATINYGTNDLNNALYAAFPILANFKVFASLFSIIVRRQKVTLLFKNLQTFLDRSNLRTIKSYKL